MTRALDVNCVGKSYGRTCALENVTLDIAPGEFAVLLGPNGAGKTTLFQLLTGLFAPDTGRVEVAGHDLRGNLRAALANIGAVFQQSTLDLDLSVRANLRFHACLHGMGRGAGMRIDEELARVGLSECAGTRVRALSGGNRRKVELARALLHRPRLLLMDEPTVGLDPGSRRALVDHVRGLCRHRGTAVLWATHLVDEAESADRVVVLHRGRRIADGAPAELRDNSECRSLGDAFLRLTGKPSEPDREAV